MFITTQQAFLIRTRPHRVCHPQSSAPCLSSAPQGFLIRTSAYRRTGWIYRLGLFQP